MSEKEDHFLDHLKRELSLPSREEAMPFVKTVMQAVRKTISRKNADTMLSKLPDFLKGTFSSSGKEEKEIPVEHLDELVTLVMEEDRKDTRRLFHDEVQTLSVILFTLKKLFTFVDPKAVGFTQPFYQEVEDAATGLSI